MLWIGCLSITGPTHCQLCLQLGQNMLGRNNWCVKVKLTDTTECNRDSVEITLIWEWEWEGCAATHEYPTYLVWSHLPANYTAYYPYALYCSPKSDWIMGAQPLPVSEQLCRTVWQPQRTQSDSNYPLSLSLCLSFIFCFPCCLPVQLPKSITLHFNTVLSIYSLYL